LGAETSIKSGSYDDLPANAKTAYAGYEDNGWKGNYSGHTAGTRSGSKYRNIDGLLPTTDDIGNSITYKEFDVNGPIPGVEGMPRDLSLVAMDLCIILTFITVKA
jgi:hypothetical protein